MTRAAPTEPDDHWETAAARAAASKSGFGAVVLDVAALLAITDYFVITSGSNRRQVLAITEEIESQIKASGGPAPLRIEGLPEAEWVLLDYGDFVAHVFLDEIRSLYDLERLWADAPRVEWDAGTNGEGQTREGVELHAG